jgi:hypothetical protein
LVLRVRVAVALERRSADGARLSTLVIELERARRLTLLVASGDGGRD